MPYTLFDPYFSGGVTRNAHQNNVHGRFCHNFDLLTFKINGHKVPTKQVVAALPDVKALIIFELDDKGDIKIKPNGEPATKGQSGIITIEGGPRSCSCSLVEFKVGNWWEFELVDDGTL